MDLGTGGNVLPLLLVKQLHSYLQKCCGALPGDVMGSTFTVPESLQICLHVMLKDSLSLCEYIRDFD